MIYSLPLCTKVYLDRLGLNFELLRNAEIYGFDFLDRGKEYNFLHCAPLAIGVK